MSLRAERLVVEGPPNDTSAARIAYDRPMMLSLRRTASGLFAWLRAEEPDLAVGLLAIAAALAAAAVCLPRGFERGGIQVPAVAAWGVMGLGVAIAALAALRPWPALLVWIVFMPFFTAARIGPVVGWVQVTSSTVILATLVCSCLLGFRRARPAVAAPPLALGGLIVLLAIISTVVSPDLSTGVSITLHGIVEPVAIAILLVLLRPGLRGLVALAVAMSVSVAIAGAVNLARMLLVVHALSDFETLRGELGRITYYNVGLFGGMLVMVLPLAAVVIARPDLPAGVLERAASAVATAAGRTATAWRPETAARATRAVRFSAWAVFAFALLVIDLTFSKSAWIAALVLGLALALAVPGTWRRRAAGLVGVAAVAGLFVATSIVTFAPSSDRNGSLDPNSVEGETSITGRFLATEAALQMTVDHPLVGVGPGQFGVEFSGPYHNPQVKEALQSAHDMIPNVAAEYGLPLALVFSLTVLAALLVAWRRWRAGVGLAGLLALGFGLALVGFMVVATLFGTDLYRTYRYMNTDLLYLGLILGAIAVLATRVEPPQATSGD
jgi:O-antigen ligase